MFKVKLKPSLHYKPWSVLRLDFGSVNTLWPGIGLEIWAHINRWHIGKPYVSVNTFGLTLDLIAMVTWAAVVIFSGKHMKNEFKKV